MSSVRSSSHSWKRRSSSRRASRYRNCSTSRRSSSRMAHELRPAAIELAVIALAHAVVAGPGVEALIEPLVAEPHLGVQVGSPRHDAATAARAFLPVVHVVLLERARGAEASHAGQSVRFLDV